MQIEEILGHFKNPQGNFPKEAVNSALEHQEAITPYLLSILKSTISNFESIEDDSMDYTFALYVLSKFREKRAFPYILELASLPEDWPEELLGDCITESLARFIVSTFNDDLAAIKKIIENPNLNEWSRRAALNSLLGLIALEKLNRNELLDYIQTLFHSPLADDEDFVTSLVGIACDIYPEELMEEINKAFENELVDTFDINKAWIKKILALGKEKCLAKYVYDDHFHLPINDIEREMSWMSAFTKQLPDHELNYEQDLQHMNDNKSNYTSPYTRSTPKTGRNDPCYCGSGIKFKKCCLN